MKNASKVFYVSIAIVTALVLMGIMMPSTLEQITSQTQGFITDTFGWYYLVVVSLFVAVCLYLLVSPVGRIKLGKQEDQPEFSRPTWLAMLFSAGIGVGLIFYGTAEPISHYMVSSPTGQEGTDQGIKDAMRFTFFHWGVHAWAVYGSIALVLAYFTFRKGELSLISRTLRPLIGKHADGPIGKAIDVIAVISTVIGVATTLGFGASQINGGLSYLFGIDSTMTSQTIIILILTVLFMISALTGLSKGIKILSNVNMGLTAVLFLIVFILGPTIFILNLFTDTIGSYLQNFVNMSFRIAPLNEGGREWINGWTIFYWAWWIAWAPFVGVFIARISKGRTIREFVVCVLLVPSLISFLWFSTFGSAAIVEETVGQISISSLATEQSLFGMLEGFPISMALSLLAILIIVTFFVTSADSGTFVLGMMTTNGSQNPSAAIKVIWGVYLSITALALLYSGGLLALQNTMIIAALPFSVVMVLMVISFLKALQKEAKELGLGQFALAQKRAVAAQNKKGVKEAG
ncbi:BCCT family transporter [Mesobacillus maritimus]|uniref:glycine betaine uptake BCCT transporter n=1 Tax=Mesobacillus maritimus TaxID=1643336 RepID=UPI00203C79A7|nr:BCCT family transporter [Mesobacillus maritimus]MCM3586941.1 BCCT family transporter [Mesobacillus maritimus]MCM3668705.1 BCCT family transporter [Mesobacillus maritimus]